MPTNFLSMTDNNCAFCHSLWQAGRGRHSLSAARQSRASRPRQQSSGAAAGRENRAMAKQGLRPIQSEFHVGSCRFPHRFPLTNEGIQWRNTKRGRQARARVMCWASPESLPRLSLSLAGPAATDTPSAPSKHVTPHHWITRALHRLGELIETLGLAALFRFMVKCNNHSEKQCQNVYYLAFLLWFLQKPKHSTPYHWNMNDKDVCVISLASVYG